MTRGRIITIGLTPAWDVHCRLDGLEWGDHRIVQSYTKEPAGKALNINKALGYLEQPSIAAGLWGANDYQPMLDWLNRHNAFIDNKLISVPGNTRANMTVEDTRSARHFHLRFPEELCSKGTIHALVSRLARIVEKNDLCVFAGSMPEMRLFENVLDAIQACANRNARIVLDTSGENFIHVLSQVRLTLLSPNLSELEELLGTTIQDNPQEIADRSRDLLRRVDMLLVSRGPRGAMVVTQEAAFSCFPVDQNRKAPTEVGCGDYLLAGFLAGIDEIPESQAPFRLARSSLVKALEKGVRLASAHAWGLTRTEVSTALDQRIATQTEEIC